MQGLAGVPPCFKGERWPAHCLFPELHLTGTLHGLLLLVVSLLHCCSLRKVSRSPARCFECSKQCLFLPGTEIHDPVDEERGSALRSAAFATLRILLDAGKIALFHHIACK